MAIPTSISKRRSFGFRTWWTHLVNSNLTNVLRMSFPPTASVIRMQEWERRGDGGLAHLYERDQYGKRGRRAIGEKYNEQPSSWLKGTNPPTADDPRQKNCRPSAARCLSVEAAIGPR